MNKMKSFVLPVVLGVLLTIPYPTFKYMRERYLLAAIQEDTECVALSRAELKTIPAKVSHAYVCGGVVLVIVP